MSEVFGLTLMTVLGWPNVKRDIGILELWSGAGNIAKAGRKRGCKVATFDVINDTRQDMTTLKGFQIALGLVLRVRKGGLLVMGPPCGSFGWLNSSKCQRGPDNDYMGDESYDKVHSGNLQACIAMFFMRLGKSRGLCTMVENPPASFCWKRKLVEPVLRGIAGLTTVTTYRCGFTCGVTGEEFNFRKPYMFASTAPFVVDIVRKCNCKEKHDSLVDRAAGAVTGRNAELQASGAYPMALGVCLVDRWLATGTASVVPKAPAPSRRPVVHVQNVLKPSGKRGITTAAESDSEGDVATPRAPSPQPQSVKWQRLSTSKRSRASTWASSSSADSDP